MTNERKYIFYKERLTISLQSSKECIFCVFTKDIFAIKYLLLC